MLSSPTTVCLCEEHGWSLLLLCWCRSNAWSGAPAETEGGPAYVRYVLPFVKVHTLQPKKKRQLHQLYSLNVSSVRLTCQRSYPTSHSFTLKNSSDPGITFRSLTVVRNISFFLCEAWTTCSVLYSSAESVILLCAACNDVSEHAYLGICISGWQRIKKIIQNKKTIRPTESSFQGLRDRKQGLFLYRPYRRTPASTHLRKHLVLSQMLADIVLILTTQEMSFRLCQCYRLLSRPGAGILDQTVWRVDDHFHCQSQTQSIAGGAQTHRLLQESNQSCRTPHGPG